MTNGAYDNPCRLSDTAKTRGSGVPVTEGILNLTAFPLATEGTILDPWYEK